ncbi:MAG: helix-turn-helix transcriptional regulator [Lachnospiraceae bacterium]|nr:helix-turn-helix transcriptional regulator [Lachnospiraceae bacterium]
MMNQVLTGKFIADERKKKGYTQTELADKLGISNRTVSKWETGNGFPDVSLLLPLCDELGITVNELLSGEKLSEDEYEKKAEENMMRIIHKNCKVSKEERIISAILTLAIIVVSITGCILGKVYTSDEALAAIGISYLVSLICIISAWIAATLSLRNRAN